MKPVLWHSKTKAAPDPSLLLFPTNRQHRSKPDGGLWTSPEGSEYGWIDWLRDNEYLERPSWHSGFWYRFHVDGEPNLLVVDSPEAVNRTMERWSLPDSLVPDLDDFALRTLDHESICAAGYDGLWLTHEAESYCRWQMQMIMYGWDCETVLWYRWCFDRVEDASADVLQSLAT